MEQCYERKSETTEWVRRKENRKTHYRTEFILAYFENIQFMYYSYTALSYKGAQGRARKRERDALSQYSQPYIFKNVNFHEIYIEHALHYKHCVEHVK